MRAIVWGAFIFITLIVQAVVMPSLSIQGIRPDLLLIVVVSASLLYGKEAGVGAGFFAGLLQDLASGNVFGLNLLAKMAVGYLFGLAERKVFKENILLPVLALLLATLLNSAIVMSFVMLSGYKIDIAMSIVHTVLPITLYNMAMAIPMHQIFAKAIRKVNAYCA